LGSASMVDRSLPKSNLTDGICASGQAIPEVVR
jgi:hypothetical protein